LAGTLLVALLQGPKPFYFDSGSYWTLGDTFTKQGTFSLLNFDSPLRGYLLPLIDHGLQVTATTLHWNSSSTAKLLNALTFSLVGSVLAPRFAEIAWPAWRWSIGRRVALTALLIVFWAGYLNYPLSDFPALAMAMLALVAVSRPDTPGWMLIAGLASGAAIDMRPSYLPLAPILLVLVLWAWLEGRTRGHISIRRWALCTSLLIIGFVVVSLPQSLSTHRYFNTWSFVPGSAAHLTSLQFTEGLSLQRYETYVGTGHAPQMRYEDDAGDQLLGRQQHHEITSTGQYLQLTINHPITMFGVFARHVVNGLDQRYNTPYVQHLDSGSHRWLRLASFLLIFLGLLRALWVTARKRLGPTRWRYPVALMLCCLTSVPSAVESRYLLPIDLLSYVVVLLPGWPNPINPVVAHRYRTPAIILGSYLAFMAVVWTIATSASHHLHFG
jgi:hypothetical protein